MQKRTKAKTTIRSKAVNGRPKEPRLGRYARLLKSAAQRKYLSLDAFYVRAEARGDELNAKITPGGLKRTFQKAFTGKGAFGPLLQVLYNDTVGLPDEVKSLLGFAGHDAPRPVEAPRGVHQHDNIENNFDDFFFGGYQRQRKAVQLYFPERKIKRGLKAPPFEIDRRCLFKKNGKIQTVWPEEGGGYVAFETAIAAIHLSSFFLGKTGRMPLVRLENSKALTDGTDSCVVSFGLAFSRVTREAEEHFKRRLFTIYCDRSTKKQFRHPLTDHFTLKRERRNRKGQIVSSNCEEIDVPENKDIALLVRIVRRVGNESRCWFICAGRTTPGTAAACFFLIHHWKELHQRYEIDGKQLDQHSLAVAIEPDDSLGFDYSNVDAVGHPSKAASLHRWMDAPMEYCIAYEVWND